MYPRLKTFLKFAFYASWALFALLGLLVLPGVFEAVKQMMPPPSGREGAAACRESRACAHLPLPQQEQDAGILAPLPVAVDERGIFGHSGFVFFRATPEWQQALRTLYPEQPEQAQEDVEKKLSFHRLYAAGLNEGAIYAITGKRWQPFHAGSFQAGGPHFNALRDKSGEYLLFYVFD